MQYLGRHGYTHTRTLLGVYGEARKKHKNKNSNNNNVSLLHTSIGWLVVRIVFHGRGEPDREVCVCMLPVQQNGTGWRLRKDAAHEEGFKKIQLLKM